MFERFKAILSQAWEIVVQRVVDLLPQLLGAIIILLVGLVVARFARALTARFFVAIRLDRISSRLGIGGFLERGDVRHTFAEVLATVVYWLVLLVSLEILAVGFGLDWLATICGEILGYLPRIVLALAIILIGIVIGTLFGGAVQAAASNADFPAPRPLGQVVKYVISLFAMIMALEQLQIATQLLISTIQIFIAAVALAVALAFGLGCKDMAAAAARNWMKKSPPAETENDPPGKST